MPPVALLLVLVAATVHATWNLLSKQASTSSGVAFVWLTALTSTVVYAPVVAVVMLAAPPHLGPAQALFLAGTAMLHAGYFLSLQAGYRRADLSVVYPIARGTGPMVASAVAIAAFGERPGPLGLLGIALIGVGLVVLGLWPRSMRERGGLRGVPFGLLTGLLIGGYTLWDAHAIQALAIPPLLQEWCSDAGRVLLLAPLAWAQRREVARVRRHDLRQVLGAGVLIPLAYILVLSALVFAPITAVAPVREVSVVVAVLFGGTLLAESDLRKRLAAAAIIVAGVVAIAIG
jgi:drug/metabolite transporter (DMT)-like permease